MNAGFVLVCVAALVLVYASPIDKSKHGVRSKAKDQKFNKAQIHEAMKHDKHHMHHRHGNVVVTCPFWGVQVLDAPVTISTLGYDNDQTCEWIVAVPEGMFINVEFTSFSVEYDSSCLYDSLSIYDSDDQGPGLAVLCGYDMPAAFRSITNHVFIRFSTDRSITAAGFEMVLTATDTQGDGPCGELNILAGIGDLHSIGHPVYANNVHCTWTITALEGTVIRVSMTAFVLECGDTWSTCSGDWVEFSDGSGYQSGRLYGDPDHRIPVNVMLESPVTVTFQTDESVTYAGFSLHYEAFYVNCPAQDASTCNRSNGWPPSYCSLWPSVREYCPHMCGLC